MAPFARAWCAGLRAFAALGPHRLRRNQDPFPVSVPTAELAASAAPTPRSGRRESLTAQSTGARFYGLLVLLALVIGAVSLLIPSTPSYDPWSWLVWGREIVHLDLQTTGGPTWKPLPMVFVTVFSLFGKAAPDLWLIVARAGAVMAVVMVFKVAATLTRLLVTRSEGAQAPAGASLTRRGAAWAPGVLSGLVAAVTLALSGGFLADNALGYSEGLLTAAVLISVERHLDGRPRQAFAVGFLAALDRPEIWLFWGPYGLWLFWRDPGARKLVFGLFALIPVLWFAPEYWGSGHFLRGVSRAHTPRSNSAAFANCPFCSELVDHAWPTVLLRVKIAAGVAVLTAASLLWRTRRSAGRWHLETTRDHALAALIGAALLGAGWFVLIAIMTQAGFSGNNRYLVLGAALIDIAGGAAFGWAARGLALRLGGVRLIGTPALWASVIVLALAYLIVPNWVGTNLINIPRTHRALVYQARLRIDAYDAIKKLGGASRVLNCGTVMTEGFQVPLVAYALGVQMLRVEAAPLTGEPLPPAPNVIFQARATRNAHLLPELSSWPTTSYQRVAQNRAFRVYANCAGGGTL
jgi:hypothetical protein